MIRLWREQHDPRVRARVLVDAGPDTKTLDPIIGLEQILAAVTDAVRRFEDMPR